MCAQLVCLVSLRALRRRSARTSRGCKGCAGQRARRGRRGFTFFPLHTSISKWLPASAISRGVECAAVMFVPESAQRFLGERRTGVDHRFVLQIDARAPPPRPRRWRPGLPLSLHDFPLSGGLPAVQALCRNPSSTAAGTPLIRSAYRTPASYPTRACPVARLSEPCAAGTGTPGRGPGRYRAPPDRLVTGVVMASAPSNGGVVQASRLHFHLRPITAGRQVIRPPGQCRRSRLPGSRRCSQHPPSSLADRHLDGPTPAPE
jgi:hypothetical protein